MELYRIVRYYKSGKREVIATGQTLEDAKKHCSDSDTMKVDEDGKVVWFDSFEKQ